MGSNIAVFYDPYPITLIIGANRVGYLVMGDGQEFKENQHFHPQRLGPARMRIRISSERGNFTRTG